MLAAPIRKRLNKFQLDNMFTEHSSHIYVVKTNFVKGYCQYIEIITHSCGLSPPYFPPFLQKRTWLLLESEQYLVGH